VCLVMIFVCYKAEAERNDSRGRFLDAKFISDSILPFDAVCADSPP